MPNLNNKKKLAAAAVAALAALGGGILATRDYEAVTTAAIEDAGLSRTSGDTRMTDILGVDVEPGAIGLTTLNLPGGARVIEVDADGFTLEDQVFTDHGMVTSYSFKLRNTGTEKRRATEVR
mgnify:CR=1 FL=1